MILVRPIIVIMCAKNYKNNFKFVEVIQERVYILFFPDTVYIFYAAHATFPKYNEKE